MSKEIMVIGRSHLIFADDKKSELKTKTHRNPRYSYLRPAIFKHLSKTFDISERRNMLLTTDILELIEEHIKVSEHR